VAGSGSPAAKKTDGEKPMVDKTCPDVDPIADRLIYASFPQALRAAMRTAAKRFSWTHEDWRLQTNMIQDAMLGGGYSAKAIATAYATAPLQEAA
jgi:hypothetical protein